MMEVLMSPMRDEVW